MNGKVTALSGDGQRAPLALLEAEHPLAGHHVRPRAVQPGGLVGAVEVHEQVPRGRLARDPLVEVDHPLVLALHEVDLDALHAPARELVERRLHLLVQRLPHDPQDQPDVALLRVRRQRGHVDLGRDRHQVAQLVPALVQDDVRDAVLRGEVDVVLVGLGVDARPERHAVDVVRVPPVPGHLARPDPRGVGELALRGQAKHDVGVEQRLVALGDHQHAPRELARAPRPCDVVLALEHALVAVAARARPCGG